MEAVVSAGVASCGCCTCCRQSARFAKLATASKHWTAARANIAVLGGCIESPLWKLAEIRTFAWCWGSQQTVENHLARTRTLLSSLDNDDLLIEG